MISLVVVDTEPFTSLNVLGLAKLTVLQQKLSNFFENNKFGKVLKTIARYIGLFFYYLGYPIVLFKRKCYDKWTSKGQKTFVAIMSDG